MRPRSFMVSGMFAAGFAAGLALAVAVWPAHDPRAVAVRGTAAFIAALAAVTAEALWRRRPWAYRACAALALAHTAAAVAWFVVLMGVDGLGAAGGYLFFSGFVVVPIMVTVREDAAALFGAAGVRAPTARRPPP